MIFIRVEVHLQSFDVVGADIRRSTAAITFATNAIFPATYIVAVPPDPVEIIVAVCFCFVHLPAFGISADAAATDANAVDVKVGLDSWEEGG